MSYVVVRFPEPCDVYIDDEARAATPRPAASPAPCS